MCPLTCVSVRYRLIKMASVSDYFNQISAKEHVATSFKQNKTTPVRKEQTKLLFAFVRPHEMVALSAIARWLRTILVEVEVD